MMDLFQSFECTLRYIQTRHDLLQSGLVHETQAAQTEVRVERIGRRIGPFGETANDTILSRLKVPTMTNIREYF